jgi:hypothetical protein
MKKDAERRWMRRLVRWGWFACFLGNYEWYRRLYGGLWAHVHVDEPCYSCMWLNCPAGADETYREWNWRGTPEFRNYDSANETSPSVDAKGKPMP